MTTGSAYTQFADLVTARGPVTDHAVVRWLERVKGLSGFIADNLPADAADAAKSAYGCWLLDMSEREAREAILPRRLHPFLALEPLAVKGADRICIVRNRTVVTVLRADAGRSVHPRSSR